MQTRVKRYPREPLKFVHLDEFGRRIEFRKSVCNVITQSDGLTIPDIAKTLNAEEDDVAQALYGLWNIPNPTVQASESEFTSKTKFYRY